GYRRFGAADVDRLRYILSAQRDQYLPLRVIKERLNRVGAAGEAGDGLLSRSELVAAAGLSDALLADLETFGLLRRVGRRFGPEALQVARAAVALTAYGVEARHLRAVRAAAERETAMIESLVAPILRQRRSGGRDLAVQTAAEMAEEVLRLHGALVDAALAEAGLATAAAEEHAPASSLHGHTAEQGVAGASA
ncbi:MAG: hypothetical protein J2P28_09115, partial [Actinobacteria bacterium]|nr:hypothetical protein [Actinomycetota bacterium]